ncbi:arylesterase [Thiosulfatimonas sediminis]|uniref:Arylesterase n=1 Tax=Thiosulfatimonas sediminis TaxID=2675054 RepID=A0A6F8PVH8_9GAMM|nr:GDSL-type esterase/lipase family protein [Thiosulfatimonas sediminis]BBP46119.1 arylesterase [Thiosulfatimonas sediminis]
MFSTLFRLVVISLLLLLSACSRPPLSPLPLDAQIVAFGDSLTAGYGVSQAQAYPAILAELSGRNVLNLGVSGETTAEGLTRLTALLQDSSTRIDLLILFEGGNDILQNKPVTQTEANLAQMLSLLENRQIPVLLIGVPEKKLFSDSAPFYQTLAQRFSIPLEDEIVSDIMLRPSLKSDYVHFNQQGYRVLAEAIYQKLVASGALAD